MKNTKYHAMLNLLGDIGSSDMDILKGFKGCIQKEQVFVCHCRYFKLLVLAIVQLLDFKDNMQLMPKSYLFPLQIGITLANHFPAFV